MATKMTRTGDTGQNFAQVIEGETPNSVEMSLTAKGQAQISVKLYYATPHDLRVNVADELAAIIEQVKLALSAAGIPLAGANGLSGVTEGK